MGLLCNAAEILPLNPPILPFPPSLHKIHLFSISATKPTISLILKPHLPALTFRRCKTRVSAAGPAHDGSTSSSAAAAASLEIDMVRNGEGVYTPRQKKVVILWDLDNKPPRGPPYAAATALRRVAQLFGDVVEISAYANHHAFVHLPNWVLEERRERRHLDALERKGLATAPSEPYACGVCGRKCCTYADLRRHFKQLHERERQKKLSRMRSLKGKKRQRYKERFISGNQKYEEAARVLLKPKVGYGLASELRRAGVFVKTVEDKPQAADWALKRQMQHSMSRGVDWLFLVSDDSDFGEMLRRAREANLGTVVVGDRDRALGRNADFWVPWIEVENGEIGEKDLRRWRNGGGEFFDEDDGLFSVSHFDGGIDGEGSLDGVVNELAAMRTEISNLRISSFSEGEEKEGDFHHITGALSWDSDTEESWEEDMDGFDL